MANQAANKVKYLLATGAIDFSSDVFKIILMQSGFTFDKDAHHGYADVIGSELATANGYTQGNMTLTLDAVTEDDVDDRTEVTWDPVSWTAGAGPIGPTCGAIIYDETEAGIPDAIIGWIDFGADYTQAAGGTATLSNIELRIS